MTKTYGAINPQQIIDMFETRARAAAIAANEYPSFARTRARLNREAQIWIEAADILLNTEFVGWNTGTRPVEFIKTEPALPMPEVQQTPADKNALREQLMRNQREACPCGYSIGRCKEIGPDCPTNRAKY